MFALGQHKQNPDHSNQDRNRKFAPGQTEYRLLYASHFREITMHIKSTDSHLGKLVLTRAYKSHKRCTWCSCACASTPCHCHNLSIQILQRALTARVLKGQFGRQMRRDANCPFNNLMNCIWREFGGRTPASEAWSWSVAAVYLCICAIIFSHTSHTSQIIKQRASSWVLMLYSNDILNHLDNIYEYMEHSHKSWLSVQI